MSYLQVIKFDHTGLEILSITTIINYTKEFSIIMYLPEHLNSMISKVLSKRDMEEENFLILGQRRFDTSSLSIVNLAEFLL